MADLKTYLPHLAYIREQERHMVQLTHDWSAINSGSYHLEGLGRMLKVLEDNFHWLGGEMEKLDLPPMESVNARGEVEQKKLGQALRIRKRPDAKLQIFLGGHYDTVFGKDHPFQTPKFLDEKTLNGPGAADLKGGLVVMLKALECFEKSPWAEKIGWEILINPDEEIGSIGSRKYLKEAAERCDLGLIFEPAMPDGALASERKGSGNFIFVMRGRAAHAGRAFHEGRNAIVALAEATKMLYDLNGKKPGVTVNPGLIQGGSAVNTVPDLAILKFNVRIVSEEEGMWLGNELKKIEKAFQNRDSISLALHGGFTRPPKPINEPMKKLMALIDDTGKLLNQKIHWQASGGCCDGNNLAAYGLPNVDNLGVKGGHIHSDQEFVHLDSLVAQAELAALILMRLASGEAKWK